jgi:hypothetical protein
MYSIGFENSRFKIGGVFLQNNKGDWLVDWLETNYAGGISNLNIYNHLFPSPSIWSVRKGYVRKGTIYKSLRFPPVDL